MQTQSKPAQKEHAEERVYTAISIFSKRSASIKNVPDHVKSLQRLYIKIGDSFIMINRCIKISNCTIWRQ